MFVLMVIVACMAGGGGGCGWGGGGGWGCGWGGGCGSGCGYWGPGCGCYGPGCYGWNGYAWGTPWGCYWTESAVCPSGSFYYPLAWPSGSPWFGERASAGAAPATGIAGAAAEDQLRALKDQLRQLEAAKAAPAHLVVKAPDGAALYIGDKAWSLDPVTRSFTSPALQPGSTYRYTLKAEVKRDGRTYTESKRVLVHAGDEVVVDFGSLGAAGGGR